MNKRSARIVKNYTIFYGWISLNLFLLIIGYMLKNRIEKELSFKKTISLIGFMYGFLFIFITIFSFAPIFENGFSFESFAFISIFITINYLLLGIPFYQSVLSLVNKEYVTSFIEESIV